MDESMKGKLQTGILVFIIAAASAATARADATLTFTSSTLTIDAGGTVEFDGTLTNTGTGDIYLNSDSFYLPYADLTVDDSPFFADSPSFLSPGDSYSGPFIDITADETISSGSYSGTYTIQGGADGDTFDDIATVDFTVDVGSTSTTPEPSPFLLMATGLAMIAVVRMRRRPVVSKQS
jgi:hypothetical protein